MDTQLEAQISAISNLFSNTEYNIQDSLEKWNKFDISMIEDFKTWKSTVEKASLGDENSIEIVKKMLGECTQFEHIKALSKSGGKTEFWYGWHTKNKIPLYPSQKLWISHKDLKRAKTMSQLGEILSTIAECGVAEAAFTALSTTLEALHAIDRGNGVYIRWDYGPPIPGLPWPPTFLKWQ